MRRWLSILLLIVLPLQALWVAAAPYCGHEPAGSAVHLGHHVHEHQDAEDDGASALPGTAHADCHVCHGSPGAPDASTEAGGILIGAAHPRLSVPAAFPAPPPVRPERPDWLSLA